MVNYRKHRILIIWPQYRSNNRILFKTLSSDNRFDVNVIWIRQFREDDVPDRTFLSKFKWHIVGANNIRVQDYRLKEIVKLLKLLIKETRNIDYILSSTQAPLHTKIAFILSKLKRKKLFVVVQQWKDIRPKTFLHLWYNHFGYFILRHCNKVFVHGTNQRKFVTSKDIKESKIAVLPFLSDDLSLLRRT